MKSFGFAEDIVVDFPDEKSITSGICLGFPGQIQVNWGNWGDTMGISLTNAMVVGFACQWVGSFQRNPDDNEISMEPLKTHEIQLDSSYRANLGTLTMLCKLASWQVAAWILFMVDLTETGLAVCFTADLLVIVIFSQRLLGYSSKLGCSKAILIPRGIAD